MSIALSETVAQTHTQSNGLRRAVHYFTTHLGGKPVTRRKDVNEFDAETEYAIIRASLEQGVLDFLAEQEIQAALSRAEQGLVVDAIPDHQTQAEFDRRVLGRLMLLPNIYDFYKAYSFFQIVEARAGNNNGQRAIYLGVDVADYNLMDARFINADSGAFFFNEDQAKIWTDLPESFA